MTKLACLISPLCFFLSLKMAGAEPELEWLRFIDSSTQTEAYTAAADSKGNIFVGSGPKLGLTKFDSAGNVQWKLGTPPDNSGHFYVKGIEVDQQDDLYLAGQLYGPNNLGQPTHSWNSSGLFFSKLRDREILFAKIGEGFNLATSPLAKARDGSFIVGGYFGYLTYDKVTITSSRNSTFGLLNISGDGSLLSTRRATAEGSTISGIATDTRGGIYLAGVENAGESVGFGGGVVAGKNPPFHFLFKLKPDGLAEWGTGVNSAYKENIFLVSAGGAYSEPLRSFIWAGDFAGSQQIGAHQITSEGGKDVFVARFNDDGTPVWVKSFGGPQDQFASSVVTDSSGAIYVAGFFFGSIRIENKQMFSRGLQDIFVAKLNSDGSIAWAKQIGYAGKDYYPGLSLTASEQLIVVGTCVGGLLVDGSFFETMGTQDGFVIKFKAEQPLTSPQLLTTLENKAISIGATLSLEAEASGRPPLAYQWWFNGAEIAGQTGPILTVPNFRETNAGNYYVTVQNAAGKVQSNSSLVSYTDASSLALNIHPSLTIFGTPGKSYRIEYATEATVPPVWQSAGSVTLTNSPQLWVDLNAATTPARFYRVVLAE